MHEWIGKAATFHAFFIWDEDGRNFFYYYIPRIPLKIKGEMENKGKMEARKGTEEK